MTLGTDACASTPSTLQGKVTRHVSVVDACLMPYRNDLLILPAGVLGWSCLSLKTIRYCHLA